MAQMKDAINSVQTAVVTGLVPVLQPLINLFTWLNENVPGFSKILGVGLVAALGAVAIAFGVAAAAQLAFLAPYLPIIAAIGVAVGAIIGIVIALRKLWDVLTSLTSPLNFLRGAVDSIGGIFGGGSDGDTTTPTGTSRVNPQDSKLTGASGGNVLNTTVNIQGDAPKNIGDMVAREVDWVSRSR